MSSSNFDKTDIQVGTRGARPAPPPLLPLTRKLAKFAVHAGECDRWRRAIMYGAESDEWLLDESRRCTCGLAAALADLKTAKRTQPVEPRVDPTISLIQEVLDAYIDEFGRNDFLEPPWPAYRFQRAIEAIRIHLRGVDKR